MLRIDNDALDLVNHCHGRIALIPADDRLRWLAVQPVPDLSGRGSLSARSLQKLACNPAQ
jgi:hypothetical protein